LKPKIQRHSEEQKVHSVSHGISVLLSETGRQVVQLLMYYSMRPHKHDCE